MYGGTERVVFNLAEELVLLGHDVTLFATSNSKTSAKLVGCTPLPIRTRPQAKDPVFRSALNLQALNLAFEHIHAGKFDIIHNHFGWHALQMQKFLKIPMITTIHGTLDKTFEPTENYTYNQYADSNFVSISDAQRKHAPKLNYISTVYNGIRPERFAYNDTPDDYFAFLGRIHPQKGPLHAIKIAKKAGIKLRIAAKIDPKEEWYFNKKIKPHIDGKQIVFLGEVGHKAKVKLLRSARALISPIQWDEPFGISNIESMVCGTPVISIKRGSVAEIIPNGVTGFTCKTIEQMIARIKDVDSIDRQTCRSHVEDNFTARLMAERYVAAYQKVLKQGKR